MQEEEERIACTTCTFLNPKSAASCEMCALPLAGGAGQQSRRKKTRKDASHLLGFEQVRREEHREQTVRRETSRRERTVRDRRSQSDQLTHMWQVVACTRTLAVERRR